MPLPSVRSTTGNCDEGLWGKSIALTVEGEFSGSLILALAGVGEAASGARPGDDGASSRLPPDCTDLKQPVSRASMRARMPPYCADPNKKISSVKICDDAPMANCGTWSSVGAAGAMAYAGGGVGGAGAREGCFFWKPSSRFLRPSPT
jgi:hypothetical protein